MAVLKRNAARQEAALKVIARATGPRGQTIMTQGTGTLPSNTIAPTEERYLGGFYRENPLFRPAMEQRTTPEVALADMARDVKRLQPR